MEAGIAALTEPGDTVIVGDAGFFGARIAEIARATAHTWSSSRAAGTDRAQRADHRGARRHHPETTLVAVVHAETSTGVRHPLAELADGMRGPDALLMADCVTSLGGSSWRPAGGASTTATRAPRSAWERRPGSRR